MKETKLTKRIFAVFVAFIVILLISCGDLQVFAYSSFVFNWTTTVTGSVNNSYLTILEQYNPSNQYSFYSISPYSSTKSGTFTYTLHYDSIYCFGVYYQYSYFGDTTYASSLYIDDIPISDNFSNPTLLPYTDTINLVFSGVSASSSKRFYFYFDTWSPTPTPIPATPTPVPTPTPEPTFNPDQPTYTTFFNHLLNDGNNALNALYLSWTQANNKFYTGIFFIGLPIMIGIFGIVASIFFGGDD